MVVFSGVVEQGFKPNVVIARQPVAPGTTAEAYRKSQLQMLASRSSAFSTVKSATLTIDGQECPYVEGETIGDGGVPLTTVIAFVKKGDLMFSLTATSSKATYPASRDAALEIFKSFTATV